MSKIISSSPDTIGEIIELNIGVRGDEVGYKIVNKLNSMSERYFNIILEKCDKFNFDIENHINKTNKFIEDMALKLAKLGVDKISKAPVGVIKKCIFSARDVLKKFGKSIKFKPWGADKLARYLSKGAVGLSIGLDFFLKGYKLWKDNELEKEFNDIKNNASNTVKAIFKNVYDTLDDENFITPFTSEFENLIKELKNAIDSFEEQNKKLNEWKKEATDKLSQYKIIDIDFEVIE